MKNNYVLIDYENVQPKNLPILTGHPLKVFVFVGANQKKIPVDLASSLQSFGDKVEYIRIGGNGSNALDFHIAFYVGKTAERDPNAYFHIVSKDSGFDPLIRHLKEKKIFAQRVTDLTAIPLLKIPNATSVEDRLQAILERLAALGHARPRKVKTLANTIHDLFMKTLHETELMSLIEELRHRQYIAVENDKVTYTLPAA